MTDSIAPRSLKSLDDALVIEWSDGAVHRLKWSFLREHCPCASCRTKPDQPEQSSQLPILNLTEAQPIGPISMSPMGNYAYSISFSDGHNTGIYSFEYLRMLGEEVMAG